MLSPSARRVIASQVGVGVAGAVVGLVLGGPRTALAGLAGGGIAAVLSLYTASKLRVAPGETPSPARALGAFLTAEVVKLLGAVGLLWAAARYFAADFVAVLITFTLALAVYLVALRWPD